VITVVDQVRPWLTLRNPFATRIQEQLRAHIRRDGAESGEPAGHKHRLAAHLIRETAREVIRERLPTANTTMNARTVEREMKHAFCE
jgi:hypothetical protein